MSQTAEAQLSKWVPAGLLGMLILLAAEMALLFLSGATSASFLLLVAANVGLILAIIAARQPAVLAYVLLLSGGVPLELFTGAERPFLGQLSLSSLRLIVVVLSLAAYVLLSRRANRFLFRSRTYLLFLAFAGLSLLYTTDLTDGVRFWFKLAYPFLVYLLLSSEIRSVAQWQSARNAIWWSLLFTVAFSVGFLSTGGSILIVQGGIPRLDLSAPAILSFYAGLLTVGFAAHYLWLRRRVFLSLALLTGIITLLTVVRITFLALGVALLLLYYFRTRRIAAVILVLLVGSVGLLFYNPLWDYMFYGQIGAAAAIGHLARGDWEFLLANLNTAGRTNAWPQLLVNLFQTSPLFGTGLGSSEFFLSTQAVAPSGILLSEATTGFGFPHNEYVRFLSELGVTGMGLVLVVYWQLWRRARRILELAASPDVRAAAVTASLAVIFLMITAITDNSFNYYAPLTGYVWAWCALATRGRDLMPDKTADQE